LRAPVWPAPPHPSSLRTGVGHELHYDVEEGEYDWADAFVYEPRRRCVGLATMHAALLASQLGRHAEAEGAIRSFGFRWRLSPCVWRAARVPARKVPPPAGSGLRDGCPVRVCPTLSLEITRD